MTSQQQYVAIVFPWDQPSGRPHHDYVTFTRAVASLAAALTLACSPVLTGCAPSHAPSTGAVAADPDPVRVLRLPDYRPGSLSNAETRAVYTQGELRMRLLNEQMAHDGYSTADRARIMVDERNALRSWARTLMRNRAFADVLNAWEPNLSFDDLVAKNRAKGLSGDDLYSAVIASSTQSRSSVNELLGVDPATPPPLPPVTPPAHGGS